MKKIIIYLILIILPLMMSVSETNGLELTQASVSIQSSPIDAEIASNESLTLTWVVSYNGNPSYEIYMTQDDAATRQIANGAITSSDIKLQLGSLEIGTYIFSLNLLAGTDQQWSNVTISVIAPPSTSEGGGSDGFSLPGFEWFYVLGTVLIIQFKRKKDKISN